MGLIRDAAVLGAGLTLINTLVSVSADAIAKDLIAEFEAPQLMVIAGLVAMVLGLGAAAAGHGRTPACRDSGKPLAWLAGGGLA